MGAKIVRPDVPTVVLSDQQLEMKWAWERCTDRDRDHNHALDGAIGTVNRAGNVNAEALKYPRHDRTSDRQGFGHVFGQKLISACSGSQTDTSGAK